MLVGRGEELAVLKAAVANVHHGLSSVCVVRGEAGIGKTTLVEHAVGSADGARLVRLVGAESELELGYGALHRLLLPFLNRIERLPRPQYQALATVFGLLQGPAPDQFLVGLATLTLLADAAHEIPVLCVVDDAQWLDTASIGVLTFVARRLLADRIGMFFCVRDHILHDSPFATLPALRLNGLDEADSLILLEERIGPANPHVARRIVTEAAGNPLAITQFAQRLAPLELSGELPIAEQLPVSKRIEATYTSRISTLSPAAQQLLLLASAEPSGDPELLWRAAEVLGITEDERIAAEDSLGDLIGFRPAVAFRHPLVRSAVYGASPPWLRRKAHGVLARVIDDRTDPDRRSWHLAAATDGPDESVAVALARSAGRAGARGGYAAESAFLARAAELTPPAGPRGARLVAAAEAAANGGDYVRCQVLLTRAEPLLADPAERALAGRLRAISLSPLGQTDDAPAALMASAQALGEFDRRLARRTWCGALAAGWQAMTRARGTTLRQLAAAVLEATPALEDGTETAEDILRSGIAARVAGDYTDAAPLLRNAIAGLSSAAETGATLTFQPMLVFVATHDLWDPDGGRALLRAAAEQGRRRGALPALWQCLECLAYTERWAGRLETGRAYEVEAEIIREAIGLGSGWKFPRVEMLALRGDDAGLRRALATVERVVGDGGLGVSYTTRDLSCAVHALSRGQYEDAYRFARRVYDLDPPLHGNQILPELVEAAVRVGDDEVAETALHRLRFRALASGTDWARGLLARSQAQVAPREQAESHYRDAIDHLEKAAVPLDHARARLLYGEWLRRERRPIDSTEQLRLAHQTFTDLGTGGFADRARAEMSVAVGRAGRAEAAGRVLTPQEEQVARLAAGGHTNREIATALFITESTAAYHLKKVFRKLNVTSRRELTRRLP